MALAAGLHAANGTHHLHHGRRSAHQRRAPLSGFNAINTIESAFDSNYNSLQATCARIIPLGRRVSSFSYTYSKTLTDNSSDRSNAPQNSYNWHEGEYGPASFDRKQIFTLNYVYPLPFLRGHSLVDRIAGGWQFSGIISAYTGLPTTVTTSSVDPAGLGLLGSSAASARPGYGVRSERQRAAPHSTASRGRAIRLVQHLVLPAGSVRRCASGQCGPLHRSRAGLL